MTLLMLGVLYITGGLLWALAVYAAWKVEGRATGLGIVAAVIVLATPVLNWVLAGALSWRVIRHVILTVEWERGPWH